MPSEAELLPLIGEELGQICLAPFTLHFSFEHWGMTVERKIEHVEPDGSRHVYDFQVPERPATVLHRLLQKSVVSVRREDEAFTLCFHDGSALVVHTVVGPYESGQIFRLNEPREMLIF